jgi:DNA-binding MarR family transcriptional regulator
MEVRVQLPDITAAEAVKAEATQLPAHALQQVSESIVQLTEEVVEILRAQATHAVRRRKKRTELWLDDLTETQGNTVIATKQLCEKSPHGTTLKKLAETIGVTPAAASVMVDLLVSKRMLERSRSESDRRAVLIRLTPETARLFKASDQSLRKSFEGLADTLGTQVLYDWQTILSTAMVALKQQTAASKPAGEAVPPAGE